MILLRFSVLFLLCGIICCQESVSTAPTGDTKLPQPAKQDQESLPLTTIPENVTVTVVDGHESQTKSDATPDDRQFIATRRKCCENGRQHFYRNGNCANRSKEETEEVGLWCDKKSMECCLFMEAYYMGPVDGCRCRNKHHNSQGTIQEDSPRENEAEKSTQSEKVTVVGGPESQTKPDATPATPGGDNVTVNSATPTDDPQFITRRRKCCEDGRQHFYTNGNCANRPQKENEAVGLWCDRKFLECCSFMEAYYMGPVDGCRCQNKQPSSQLPSPENLSEDSSKDNEAEKLSQSENVTVANGESQTKPDTSPATPRVDDVMTPTEDPQYIGKRKKCCENGRQHFYTNGNCANRPQKENEAVGLWCDRKFLQCCSFMEAYYMGPVGGCRNKLCNSQLPSPTDTTRVTNTPLN
ncbi:uncharacterized protein LOC120913830 [Rana temporaria]|uniref:uncharacterized protein LOC120913830 n=1 Tax=Rana temporaria TaxID=8407 RepID=UPI001AAD4272|nr:uncharacterized protein LOC120913830 [Rana temporaria]